MTLSGYPRIAIDPAVCGGRPVVAGTRMRVTDVLDGLGHPRSALPREIRPLKPEWKVLGKAWTLSCVSVAVEPKQPYAIELACVDALQAGQVLVATTNSDLGSALWGELLSTASRAHGAEGQRRAEGRSLLMFWVRQPR